MCEHCKNLMSLEGAPKEVFYFSCRDCAGNFTKEDVEAVCKVKRSIII